MKLGSLAVAISGRGVAWRVGMATQLFATCVAGLEFVVQSEIEEKIPTATVDLPVRPPARSVAVGWVFLARVLSVRQPLLGRAALGAGLCLLRLCAAFHWAARCKQHSAGMMAVWRAQVESGSGKVFFTVCSAGEAVAVGPLLQVLLVLAKLS